MNRRQFLMNASALLTSTQISRKYSFPGAAESKKLADGFTHPPASSRPWVYAFWMEGNVTKEGITADLEGMQRAGIGGLLFMDGALGNPPGPHRFMSDSWLQMFDHMLKEADRLGLEINVNNDPGWSGSSGPWVKPDQAAQKVVASETVLQGPFHFDDIIPRPTDIKHDYYRDIAVLAYPLNGAGRAPTYRIPEFNSTKSFAGGTDFAGVVPWPRFIPTNPQWPAVLEDQLIQAASVVDLTSRLDPGERLTWDVPSGHWIVFRFGHTVANGGARSAQIEAQGLECDKLSKTALDAHFSAMVAKLAERAGSLAGKVVVSTHIDSWEAGSGNWTDGFQEFFRRFRGYEMLPYLPALNGVVVDSREVSERFLWDFRETVSELLLQNYAGYMRELAHSKGLRLSIEAYDGTCDDLRYAGRADEPMSEFWRSCYSGLPLSDLSENMASAAHVYGHEIVGAEAFTATRGDFLDHPATLKPLADWAFCTGINRLCFSEWVMQPWPHLVPGISFSTFGTAFHQSLTWWPQSKPWHEYVTRCQYMLRQGHFVADVCFIAPEGAPCRFTAPIPATTRGGIPDRPPYNFDGCPAELVIDHMTVENGRVSLPSGMNYALLVLPTYRSSDHRVMNLMEQGDYFYKPEALPEVRAMTPELLRSVKRLVEAGATVLGHRPLKSPSLTNFPQCDREVTELSDALWGTSNGFEGSGERRLGKGRVLWGKTPDQVLVEAGVTADFTCEPEGRVNYTHRRMDDGTEIYFLVNKQSGPLIGKAHFRVRGKQPELHWPQAGVIEPAITFEPAGEGTTIPLSLNANESVFVVFRESKSESVHLVSVTKTGERVWPCPEAGSERFDDSCMMAAWMRPGPDLVLPNEQNGAWAYSDKAMRTPGLGYQTMTSPGQGLGGFAIGRNGVVVFRYGESGEIDPMLVHRAPINEPVHVGVLCKNRVTRLFINGELVKTATHSPDSGRQLRGWADQRPFAGEIAAIDQFEDMLQSGGITGINNDAISDSLRCVDFMHRLVWESGDYLIRYSDGSARHLPVDLPPSSELLGPWQVAFDSHWGGPKSAIFEKLISWSDHPTDGIRYYSGTAIYRRTFNFHPSGEWNSDLRIFLDLGRVCNLADVTLNGKCLGTLWNAPYRTDVSEVIGKGENTLEIKVVNVWVNRLIGDEQLPPDSDVAPDGQLRKWPDWLLQGKQSPTGRFTFTTHRLWTKNSPLLKSGLLGPVHIVAAGVI